jgi:hypothetical protein
MTGKFGTIKKYTEGGGPDSEHPHLSAVYFPCCSGFSAMA